VRFDIPANLSKTATAEELKQMDIFTKVFVTLRGVVNHPLHRRSKLKALCNFFTSQIAARAVRGDVCVAFPNQTKLLISPGMRGAAHFIDPGLCEFEDMSFVMHFLRPEDLFIDVGANVGAYTVLAAGVSRSKAISFEPGSLAFGYLKQNVKLNDLEDKVTYFNTALGSEDGILKFTEGLGTENYICLDGDSVGKTEVKVTTLDQALEGLSPTLMKIDVEGFETKVLAGGQKTLSEPSLKAMIIERGGNAERYGFNEAALHRKIQAMSFIPCAYSPQDRVLSSISKDALGNIIYVKDLEFARKRLKEAQPYLFGSFSI